MSGIDAEGDGGKRQDKRDSLFLSARLSIAGAPPVTARVRNLSAGGMLVELPAEASAGDAIEGDLRGVGAISGMIVWIRSGHAGIAFDDDVEPKLARTPTGAKTSTPAYYANAPVKRPALRPLR